MCLKVKVAIILQQKMQEQARLFGSHYCTWFFMEVGVCVCAHVCVYICLF